MRKFAFVLFFCTLLFVAGAQDKKQYDQHLAFSPGMLLQPESSYRSAAGTPGLSYWQNKADYSIAVTLDTATHTVSGTATVTYTNNSPDPQSYLWFELGQNLFMEGSRGSYAQHVPTDAGGFQFSSVALENGQAADYIIDDTRMQIRLPEPLSAKGAQIRLKFEYRFQISDKQFRTGRVSTKNGTIYEVAQWYPRVCVYDDIRGWNTLPYLGSGEFYCEYGDFDYAVTVPWDMIVAGSGELLNAGEVLTRKQLARLQKAGKSDHTQYIIEPAEAARQDSRPIHKGTLTWKFKMTNSRDVAWAASKGYVWDAARINLPQNKSAMAMSFYPVESLGDTAWSRSTEYLKHTIEHFSAKWFPYPYPAALNIAGSVGGMEYPGLCFCGWKMKKAKTVYYVTAHEIGHNWFPMIVGSDERRFAFMDEGFNTFIDIYAQDDFNRNEFGPKSDGEYDPEGKNPARDLVPYLTSPGAESLCNLADVVPWKSAHTLNYYKSALGLVLAREYILGADRFDYAFREYIRQWAYRHPTPNDFFRLMNNAAGEDLNWFWNAWYCQTWTLDQGVKSVTYVENDPAKGSQITLVNNRQMVMPVKLRITEQNGQIRNIRLPVEVWQQGGEYVFNYRSAVPLRSVVVDPDEQLPDADPSNNSWISH
ncbi:MAG: M1 family metallopeptidase [Mangrovibacterium sp.]